VNEAQPQSYPPGIEYRTPRPRGTLVGILLGGLLGLALTEKPGGAIAGGALGGAITNKPLELPQAIRQKFAEMGLEVVQYYRLGRFGAKVMFKYGDVFVAIESHAPCFPEMSPEQIDDWLYGDLTEQRLSAFLQQYAQRLPQ
jgi:hypothetical protein